MKKILILLALQSSAHTKLRATMENEPSSQLEKNIRSYGGVLFTSVLILGATFYNQQNLQVLLTQQQSLMTQQDSQGKGLTTLNLKLDSAGYGVGLTLGIFASSGNIVQVLRYYDDVRALQRKEKKEQEQNAIKTENQTHQQEKE